ncbi:MAG: FtsX-like permease family protein [Nitrospinales bacterium]
MGMDARRIVWMFTAEGGLAALGALALAALIGVPFFAWFQQTGFDVSHLSESSIPVQEAIFLDLRSIEICFSAGAVAAIMVAAAWLPVRKITRLDPTQALRGRAFS